MAALVFGWFCVRLTGVYLAMLTLAFAQITWSVAFQWYDVTGGDNGILGVWPSAWASSAERVLLSHAGDRRRPASLLLRQFVFAPFGMGLRACRDSPLRAEAIGIDRAAHQRLAFVVAGAFAGIAGALYAFLKGSVFPDVLGHPAVGRRPGDGAAGRRADADRPGRRRRRLQDARRCSSPARPTTGGW